MGEIIDFKKILESDVVGIVIGVVVAAIAVIALIVIPIVVICVKKAVHKVIKDYNIYTHTHQKSCNIILLIKCVMCLFNEHK